MNKLLHNILAIFKGVGVICAGLGFMALVLIALIVEVNFPNVGLYIIIGITIFCLGALIADVFGWIKK